MAKVLLQNDESDVISSNLEMFIHIWLDATINNIKENENNEQQLRNVINHLQKFEDEKSCQQYIEQRSEEERLILVLNDLLGRTLVPHIHQLRQVCSIYVYCKDKQVNEEWTSEFTKVRLP